MAMNLSLKEVENLCNANDLDPVNMVDPDMIVDNVLQILKYMQEPKIVKLKNNNYAQYERRMQDKFPTFSDDFFFIFKKVISGEDITPLYGMLCQIKLIKEGKKEFENAENSVIKGLCDKYVIKK